MLSHFPLGFAPPEVAFPEVFYVSGVDSPVMSLTVSTPSGFDEAVVQREVVPDGVPPAWPPRSEVGVVVQDVLVDIRQD